MRLSAWQFIFFLTLVYACGYANAGAIAKRAASDEESSGGLSGLVQSVIDMTRNVPIVGDTIGDVLQWFVKFISLFEVATNGALARILGGALPCTVALSGTTCSGLTNNGGFGKVMMDVLDSMPPLLLPGFVKTIITLIIQLLIDPTVDVLFGGVVIDP